MSQGNREEVPSAVRSREGCYRALWWRGQRQFRAWLERHKRWLITVIATVIILAGTAHFFLSSADRGLEDDLHVEVWRFDKVRGAEQVKASNIYGSDIAYMWVKKGLTVLVYHGNGPYLALVCPSEGDPRCIPFGQGGFLVRHQLGYTHSSLGHIEVIAVEGGLVRKNFADIHLSDIKKRIEINVSLP